MKKNIYITIILICIFIIHLSLNPLRKPVGTIRKCILEKIPIGLSKEDVYKYINNQKKWKANEIMYLIDGTWYHYDSNNKKFIKEISIEIGTYIFGEGPYTVSVEVFFEFDVDSKLIDVKVKKYADAI